jgi:hypothetical protein
MSEKSDVIMSLKTKLHGLSPRANYTDRATAACRRSDCQLLRIQRLSQTVQMWVLPDCANVCTSHGGPSLNIQSTLTLQHVKCRQVRNFCWVPTSLRKTFKLTAREFESFKVIYFCLGTEMKINNSMHFNKLYVKTNNNNNNINNIAERPWLDCRQGQAVAVPQQRRVRTALLIERLEQGTVELWNCGTRHVTRSSVSMCLSKCTHCFVRKIIIYANNCKHENVWYIYFCTLNAFVSKLIPHLD